MQKRATRSELKPAATDEDFACDVVGERGWSGTGRKRNIYVSELLRSEIWVLSPDGSKRVLIANKANAPLDNNTSLVLKGDVLCTAYLGFTHARPEEADRTVVCMKGFPVPE